MSDSIKLSIPLDSHRHLINKRNTHSQVNFHLHSLAKSYFQLFVLVEISQNLANYRYAFIILGYEESIKLQFFSTVQICVFSPFSHCLILSPPSLLQAFTKPPTSS